MSFDNEYFDINTPTPCDYCNNYKFGCQKQGHRSFVLGIDFIFNNDDEVQCMYFEVKDSEKEKAEASKLLNNAKQTVFDSEQKAIEIVKNAQVTAENKINDVQKELEIKIENQKIQAHKDIEAEREKMLKEAKSEIVAAAISTSKEILGREVKVSDNDKFVDDFINEIEKK